MFLPIPGVFTQRFTVFAKPRLYRAYFQCILRHRIYGKRGQKRIFGMIFIFRAPLKIILTMTVCVRISRLYNQVKLSLVNVTEFIRELRLGYGANGIQSAINKVKSMCGLS